MVDAIYLYNIVYISLPMWLASCDLAHAYICIHTAHDIVHVMSMHHAVFTLCKLTTTNV